MKNPSGYWNYAGRVALHLRKWGGFKWRDLADIWGTDPGTLHNATFPIGKRELIPKPRPKVRWIAERRVGGGS